MGANAPKHRESTWTKWYQTGKLKYLGGIHMSVIGFHLLCASLFMILVGLFLDKEDMNW